MKSTLKNDVFVTSCDITTTNVFTNEENKSNIPRCQPQSNSDEPTVPDGRWGWMVTFASFMHNFLVDGISCSFGIFFNAFLEHFGESKGKTQMLGSFISGYYLLIGPLVCIVERRYKCRKTAVVGSIVASLGLFLSTFSPNLDVMVLLYGIVAGTGFGLLYGPSILIVSYYFDKRRALATGIAVCGSGIGGFVFAPLGGTLLEVYGWQGAMWIISAIVLNSVVFAALYRPIQHEHVQRKGPKTQRKFPKDDNKLKSICALLRSYSSETYRSFSPAFVVHLLSCSLVSAGFYIPFNFLPTFALDKGISAFEGAFLISIIGIFNTIFRVVIGVVSDRSWLDCILVNGFVLVVGGVATFFTPYFSSFGVLAAYSAVFGSTIGVFVPLRSIILIELRGVDNLSTEFGLLTMFIGVSVIVGSPIAGLLSDMTGDLDVTFYLSGSTITLGGILCLPLRRILIWEQKKQERRIHESTKL